jgi:hypothetical protein
MRPFRGVRWVCALGLLGLGAAPAQAAWDNVFQVCCFGCKSRPAVSGYAPVACCPAPCPQTTCCTTQYVQRSYYTPVTCYQTQVSYQPITTYRTSYYYEPVTSYRYSCYYDPCTCSYQQVACPQTCYRLRSQTCATTSYLQRTCQVPVTSYRLSYYYEPVTTCSSTPCCSPCATPCCNGAAAPAVAAPAVAAPAVAVPAVPAAPGQGVPAPATPQPGVNETRTPAATPSPSTGPYDRYYTPQTTQPPPMAKPNSFTTPSRQAPPPVVRFDRIVALPQGSGPVQGQVVRFDNNPKPGAQLLFVNADRQAPRQAATTDRSGHFRVSLSSGAWLVYLTGADGKPAFHSKIEVRPDSRPLVLVSR